MWKQSTDRAARARRPSSPAARSLRSTAEDIEFEGTQRARWESGAERAHTYSDRAASHEDLDRHDRTGPRAGVQARHRAPPRPRPRRVRDRARLLADARPP